MISLQSEGCLLLVMILTGKNLHRNYNTYRWSLPNSCIEMNVGMNFVCVCFPRVLNFPFLVKQRPNPPSGGTDRQTVRISAKATCVPITCFDPSHTRRAVPCAHPQRKQRSHILKWTKQTTFSLIKWDEKINLNTPFQVSLFFKLLYKIKLLFFFSIYST